MTDTTKTGPRIGWLLTDGDTGTVEFYRTRPDYYSGTLVQIVYWEVLE